jgi:hypothetical protein
LILIRYYFQTAKIRALYKSTDEPAGRLADNSPKSDRLQVEKISLNNTQIDGSGEFITQTAKSITV